MTTEEIADAILIGTIPVDKILPSGVRLANARAIRDENGLHFIVYITVNLSNSKYYVGQHQTSNPYDSYIGSGHYFQKALKKYGVECFVKYVIADYNTFDEMNSAEKDLVKSDSCFPKNKRSYNIKEGGNDGCHITATRIRQSRLMLGRYAGSKNPMSGKNVKDFMTPEAYADMRRRQKEHNKLSEIMKEKWRDPVCRKSMQEKISKKAKGRTVSAEVKKRISETLRAKNTKWWTNGVVQLRASECPEGFWRGKLGTPKDKPVKIKSIRIKKEKVRLGRVGLKWWNNGVIERKSRSPIEGMKPGRLRASEETRAKMRASNRSKEIIDRIMSTERDRFMEWHKRAIRTRQENFKKRKVIIN